MVPFLKNVTFNSNGALLAVRKRVLGCWRDGLSVEGIETESNVAIDGGCRHETKGLLVGWASITEADVPTTR